MLAEKDLKTLTFSILWVFEAVAAADDQVDGKEETVLQEAVRHWAHGSNPLLARIASALLLSYEATREAYHDDPRTIDGGLAEAMAILRKECSLDERDAFRRELIEFATKVAKASGSFLGLTNPISAAERSGIEKVRASLGVG